MKKPARTCVSCRERGERHQLLRLVCSPAGDVVVDYRGKLPGRGVWVHFRPSCLDELPKRREWIKRQIGAAPDIEAIRSSLRSSVIAACADGLSIAQAGGALAAGFDVLRHALGQDRVDVVLVASDASERTIGRLRDVAGERVVFVVGPWTRADLGARTGRGARAAVGVLRSSSAKHLSRQLRRLRLLG